jgi:hypothetical protein
MNEEGRNDEVYSKAVRAGKRTYFFDVKSTRNNDLYLTLTESKKSTRNGEVSFQKHKLFLYKEDFEKFKDGLCDALDKIADLKTQPPYDLDDPRTNQDLDTVKFDDLD